MQYGVHNDSFYETNLPDYVLKVSSYIDSGWIASIFVTTPGRPWQVPPLYMNQFAWVYLEANISAPTLLARDSLTLVSGQEDIVNWGKVENDINVAYIQYNQQLAKISSKAIDSLNDQSHFTK